MKAEIHSGWGAIEHNGETYDVQDGTLEADETVITALHERYGEKVKPLDESAENVESVEEPVSEGDTFYCGVKKSDGEPCGREVDAPSEVCWQH